MYIYIYISYVRQTDMVRVWMISHEDSRREKSGDWTEKIHTYTYILPYLKDTHTHTFTYIANISLLFLTCTEVPKFPAKITSPAKFTVLVTAALMGRVRLRDCARDDVAAATVGVVLCTLVCVYIYVC